MATHPQAPMFVREMGLPARFVLYVLVCLVLMSVDLRYHALSFLRTGIATVLSPIQAILSKPFTDLGDAFDFFSAHGELVRENHQLREERRRLMQSQLDEASLRAELAHMRSLLGLPTPRGFTSHAAEIVQAISDPFARKVLVNRGNTDGIEAGWPAVDALGLVGQVTAVYPFSSEITLITSRLQAVPVQSLRNGLHLIVSGIGQDRLLEVRYLDMHADLKPGDVLVTSGLDGKYPPGIPVAKVLSIEPPRYTPFARAVCEPLAGVGEYRHLLILQRTGPHR
jgi:rod shape-determining protein MreC